MIICSRLMLPVTVIAARGPYFIGFMSAISRRRVSIISLARSMITLRVLPSSSNSLTPELSAMTNTSSA